MKILFDYYSSDFLKALFGDIEIEKYDTDIIESEIEKRKDIADKLIYLECIKKNVDNIEKDSQEKMLKTDNSKGILIFQLKNDLPIEYEESLYKFVEDGIKKIKKEIKESQELSKILDDKSFYKNNITYNLIKNTSLITDFIKNAKISKELKFIEKVLNSRIKEWEKENNLNYNSSFKFYSELNKYIYLHILISKIKKYVDDSIEFWKDKLIMQKQNILVKDSSILSDNKDKIIWLGTRVDLISLFVNLEMLGFVYPDNINDIISERFVIFDKKNNKIEKLSKNKIKDLKSKIKNPISIINTSSRYKDLINNVKISSKRIKVE
jgi:hypothetical protein